MIRLEAIHRTWPDFAIRGVSLDVAAGEYVVLVGPTGAGKTLLLELLLGIHRPDAGRVFVDGRDVTHEPPERRGLGMVYQDYALFPHLDVRQNIAFGLRYHPPPDGDGARAIAEIARRIGIEHLLHRRTTTLSGGERQRVAIARALITRPRVLLLDEPLSALDRATALHLRSELAALHADQGLTVLHVTHDLAEARALGTRLVLIHQGAVHGEGAVEDVLRRPQSLFAARFIGAVNLFPGARTANGIVAGPIVAGAGAPEGEPHVLVQPDEVAVLAVAETPPAINVLHGTVAELRDEPHHIAVAVRIDGLQTPITAHLGRQAARAAALQLGQPVAVDLRNALHLLYE